MTGTLLVVDWDFFFPNPIEALDRDIYPHGARDEVYGRFDWGHAESPLFIGPVLWVERAAAFVRDELPLPTVNGQWRTFTSRFDFSDEATMIVSESNTLAGLMLDSNDEPFDELYLYDAHHDCGYKIDSYQQWLRNFETNDQTFTCEDWMLVQQRRGVDLHYRSPSWHKHYRESAPQVPAGVALEHRVDDPSLPLPAPVIDAVFVCRSGAWVPPWCDPQFAEFLDTFPITYGVFEQDREAAMTGFIRSWGQPELDQVTTVADLFLRLRAANQSG